VGVSFTVPSVTHALQPAYLDTGDENHVICLEFKRQNFFSKLSRTLLSVHVNVLI